MGDIQTATIIWAGTVGIQIAAHFANSGLATMCVGGGQGAAIVLKNINN